VTVRTLDKSSMNIKIWTKDLQKYFEKGEMVRIMSGVHAGGSGTITAILEKHAIVAMEGTRNELKILISNLKIKRDEMDHCVKAEGLVKKTMSIKVSYSAGDMILFDN
jgi:ribosomal protein L24